jgi:hypothetical protein
MLKHTSLYLFILVLTHPSLSFSNDNSSIFTRLDNSEAAKVIEYTCDNEPLQTLPFAEICEMRDGGVLTFSPYEICEGYINHPDCTHDNIQVFNRSSSVYIKYNNVFYTITNTHLLFYGGTKFTELKNRDIACYKVQTKSYPYTDMNNAVWADPDLEITSSELDGKEVVIYGIVESIPIEIRGTALYSDNGMTRTKGEINITGVTNKREYLKRRFVMNVPSRDWRGLSGSPVYYNNKLVGIVSSGADTFITFNPPEDIRNLLKIHKGTLKALKGFKGKRK